MLLNSGWTKFFGVSLNFDYRSLSMLMHLVQCTCKVCIWPQGSVVWGIVVFVCSWQRWRSRVLEKSLVKATLVIPALSLLSSLVSFFCVFKYTCKCFSGDSLSPKSPCDASASSPFCSCSEIQAVAREPVEYCRSLWCPDKPCWIAAEIGGVRLWVANGLWPFLLRVTVTYP